MPLVCRAPTKIKSNFWSFWMWRICIIWNVFQGILLCFLTITWVPWWRFIRLHKCRKMLRLFPLPKEVKKKKKHNVHVISLKSCWICLTEIINRNGDYFILYYRHLNSHSLPFIIVNTTSFLNTLKGETISESYYIIINIFLRSDSYPKRQGHT